jgi:hypothetical protein
MRASMPRRLRPTPHAALLALAAAGVGCASLAARDLVPPTLAPQAAAQRREGAVAVHGTVLKEYFDGTKVVRNSVLLDARMLTEALAESAARHGPFAEVRKDGADLVLDVWVERITRTLEFTGEGYVIDLVSIWRLTRVGDGKVLACEPVKGHGGSHAFGSSAAPLAMGAAGRDMIQRGLAMLADPSAPHLAAMETAGLRPSMGGVVPEGLARLMERVRQSWPQLRTGMTIAEVEALLGPVTASSTAYTQGSGHSQHFSNGLYTLAFIDGRLSFWELAPK